MKIPSSWEAKRKGDSWQVINEKGSLIATINKNENMESYAKLIAASPYMLNALKAVMELIGDDDLPDNGELSGAAIWT